MLRNPAASLVTLWPRDLQADSDGDKVAALQAEVKSRKHELAAVLTAVGDAQRDFPHPVCAGCAQP